MTNTTELQTRFTNVSDFELFANYLKDALTERIRLTEKFSAVRLRNTRLAYNEFMHRDNRLGQADFRRNTIEARVGSGTVLDFANTIIHECGHILVGPGAAHNEDWQEACFALGLRHVEAVATRPAQPEDFDPEILRIIIDAVKQFRAEYPELIHDPNMEIPFPPGMEPMPFQIEGIREMLSRKGNILLADEMGLGKTVSVMGYINATNPRRILVGCPNNAKLIWKRHFEQWCVHDYEVEVAHTRLYTFGDVVIMNYEAITKWGDALRRQDWDLIVYDEGHYLKTPSAKRSRACYAIKARKAIIVTGTPIVNYPYELFPIIHYLDRPNWPEYGIFESMFGSRGSDRLGRNLNRLNAMLRATIMTRRLKKDVLTELPRKRRQIIEFETDDDIRKLIEEEKRLFNSINDGASSTELVNFLNAMKNEGAVADSDFDWAAIVEELKYTRRYAFEEMARIAHKIGLAKLPYVIEHIENALEAREKVLVFGHHRDVLTAIAERFAPGSVLLLGGNRDQALATQQAADRFNSDPECKVFVAQVSIAQGYSVQGSSTVIFVEEDWVPGIMTQAEDRVHGIGRGMEGAKSLLIQHLVFEDSLDTYKAKLTIKKQKSIDRAVGN